MTIATHAIIDEGAGSAKYAGLSPAQALEQHAHFKRRLERRARSYAAARQRLSLAREDFQHIDQLAAEARVYFPVGASA